MLFHKEEPLICNILVKIADGDLGATGFRQAPVPRLIKHGIEFRIWMITRAFSNTVCDNQYQVCA
jgi:hypothetical protein